MCIESEFNMAPRNSSNKFFKNSSSSKLSEKDYETLQNLNDVEVRMYGGNNGQPYRATLKPTRAKTNIPNNLKALYTRSQNENMPWSGLDSLRMDLITNPKNSKQRQKMADFLNYITSDRQGGGYANYEVLPKIKPGPTRSSQAMKRLSKKETRREIDFPGLTREQKSYYFFEPNKNVHLKNWKGKNSSIINEPNMSLSDIDSLKQQNFFRRYGDKLTGSLSFAGQVGGMENFLNVVQQAMMESNPSFKPSKLQGSVFTDNPYGMMGATRVNYKPGPTRGSQKIK